MEINHQLEAHQGSSQDCEKCGEVPDEPLRKDYFPEERLQPRSGDDRVCSNSVWSLGGRMVWSSIWSLRERSAGVVIDRQDRFGRTALFWAAVKGYTEAVRVFLEYNANPDVWKENGLSLIYETVAKRHIEVVILLLQYLVNQKSKFLRLASHPFGRLSERIGK